MKLCWTTIQVSDLERSVEFYTDVLGLGPVARMGVPGHGIAMLGGEGGTRLELICEDKPLPEGAGAGVSIGFAPDDLDALIAGIRAKGVQAAGPVSPSPFVRFYFVRDPDGYTVQLVEQKK